MGSFCFKLPFCPIPECCFRKQLLICHFLKKFFFFQQSIFDTPDDRIFIKICIRDRRKQIHYDHLIYTVRNLFSLGAKPCRHCAESFRYIYQQILHGCYLWFLTTDPGYCTSTASCCFLALKAKHFVFFIFHS